MSTAPSKQSWLVTTEKIDSLITHGDWWEPRVCLLTAGIKTAWIHWMEDRYYRLALADMSYSPSQGEVERFDCSRYNGKELKDVFTNS